jgi:hypothetical protein
MLNALCKIPIKNDYAALLINSIFSSKPRRLRRVIPDIREWDISGACDIRIREAVRQACFGEPGREAVISLRTTRRPARPEDFLTFCGGVARDSDGLGCSRAI